MLYTLRPDNIKKVPIIPKIIKWNVRLTFACSENTQNIGYIIIIIIINGLHWSQVGYDQNIIK